MPEIPYAVTEALRAIASCFIVGAIGGAIVQMWRGERRA